MPCSDRKRRASGCRLNSGRGVLYVPDHARSPGCVEGAALVLWWTGNCRRGFSIVRFRNMIISYRPRLGRPSWGGVLPAPSASAVPASCWIVGPLRCSIARFACAARAAATMPRRLRQTKRRCALSSAGSAAGRLSRAAAAGGDRPERVGIGAAQPARCPGGGASGGAGRSGDPSRLAALNGEPYDATSWRHISVYERAIV